MEVSGELVGLVLSISFGLWAAVVGWAANAVVRRIDLATADLKHLDEQLSEFIRAAEARMVRMESWQDNHDRNHERGLN